ncbi:MAG: insulinase family protein [Deferrisomatales bacterium]
MPETPLREGQEIHGFVVRRRMPLPELNARLIELDHGSTGARYLHLANADDNNLFAVGFRTPPRDATGAPHILEHTVLCGSRRYPVRDPFFSMLRRSLSTFMNALTADDWTLYPFSTRNRADFYNLLSVYLDAVFFPLLRERDFRQEGHRLEFADPEDPRSPLVIKGVVYNEMKGHMADPYSLLGTRTAEALFPTSPYGRNSGGEPEHIPELTWEALRAFHASCYHPSNAYFFSYGNLPLEPHLEAISRQALAEFRRREVDTAVPPEVRFTEPRRVEVPYPVDRAEAGGNRAMVQVAWLTCDVTEAEERLGMTLLSTLLLGNPAAPLYKALLDSKLGANLSPGSGYDDERRDTVFASGLQGTASDAGPAVEELVLATLERLAGEGFARERIEAAIQQIEFAHREVRGDHYPYGLGLLMRVMGPWIHGADPAQPLLLGEHLERLRGRIDAGGYFEALLRRWLLDNPHRVTLTLKPDPDLAAREEQRQAARLAERRAALTEEQVRALLDEARELARAQESPEDLSVLPGLELSDIPREEPATPYRKGAGEGPGVYRFPQPTNGIAYVLAHLDTEPLPGELSPYLPVFCTALSLVGAAGQDYVQMAERIAAATGGIRAGATLLDHPSDTGRFRAAAQVQGKALVRNREKMFGILADLFAAPDFSDTSRLHTILNQLRVNLENSLPAQGHRYAARAAAAGLTPTARLREHWFGIEHLRFVRTLATRGPEELDEVADALARVARRLLVRTGLECAVAAEERELEPTCGALGGWLDRVPAGEGLAPAGEGPEVAPLAPRPARRGLAAAVPVSYVARVFPCVPFTHPDAPGLLVLAKLLRSGYLHREIREKGGAYGGLAAYAAEGGLFSLLSYRDPHLTRTLRVFDEAARWAAAGRFGAEEVKEAILGVFSDLDRPLSPGGKAAHEFACLRQGLTREMRQHLREGVLAVSKDALAGLAERYLVQGRASSAVGVVASAELLEQANQELGDEALAVEPI